MGGGSAGKARVRTGHGHIGIELSPEYLAISRQRLENIQAKCGNRTELA